MVVIDIKEYLTPDKIGTGVTAEFTDEGRYVDPEETGFDKRVFQIGIKIGEDEYIWTMNKTSQKEVAKAFGRDTLNWVGRRVKLIKRKESVFGKIRDVIYAEPIKE